MELKYIIFLCNQVLLADARTPLFQKYSADLKDLEDDYNLCNKITTNCNTVIEMNWEALENNSVQYDPDSDLKGRNPVELKLEFRERDPVSGVRSAVFSNGANQTTAYFTYNDKLLVGSIHRPDGKTERIVSIDNDKQLRLVSCFNTCVSHYLSNNCRKSVPILVSESMLDSSSEVASKVTCQSKIENLKKVEKEMLQKGKNDTKTFAKIVIDVWYNSDVKFQMIGSGSELFIGNLLLESNFGYLQSGVPIRLQLGKAIQADESFSDANLESRCYSKDEDLSKMNFKMECIKYVIFPKSKETVQLSGSNANIAIFLSKYV